MNYSAFELKELGIRFGKSPRIHKSVIFFRPDKIIVGDNVRIDCFSVLSAGDEAITIGRNVHIGMSSIIFGTGGRVVLADFAGLSTRVTLLTGTDDYSEGWLTNPTVPERYRKVRRGDIILDRHALVGAASVVLPGVALARGASVGAMSLVHQDIGEYEVVFGVPFRVIGRRDRDKLQRLEEAYLAEEDTQTEQA